MSMSRSLEDNEDWPVFDCRVFNIPEDEITNYFWWRLLDATRNSIQSVAQSKFKHKQLHKKDTKQMQEMLFQEHGINWADLPQEEKSGMVCYKASIHKEMLTCNKCGAVAPTFKGIMHKAPCSSREKIETFTVYRPEWQKYPAPATRAELNVLIQNALISIEGRNEK